jgi:hypothetical protein
MNKIANLNLQKYTKIQPTEIINSNAAYVSYGANNLYPQYLLQLYSESPVHGSLVTSIASMIAGKGLTSNNLAVQSFLKKTGIDLIINNVAFDTKLQGGYYLEVIATMDGQGVAKVNQLPFENCRLEVNDIDQPCAVWYSRDWTDTRKAKNKPQRIELAGKYSLKDCPRQIVFHKLMSPGSMYYPKPDYVSSINWIELTRQISEYHVNQLLNGLFPSFHISFENGVPDPEGQREQTRDIEKQIGGAYNSGKWFATWVHPGEKPPVITPFPLTDADKQYAILSEQATANIMIAHRVTSPLMFGVRDGGGLGSNTDEIKISDYRFTKQVIEPFQRLILNGIEDILLMAGLPLDIAITPNEVLLPETSGTTGTVEVAQKKKDKLEEESFKPTKEMSQEAELGLKWRDEYNRGGTMVGVARARDISNMRNLSLDTVKRMNSYFSRHEVDKQAKGWNQGEDGFPTAGRVAWQLWGGDPGKDWSARIVERIKSEQAIDPTEVDEQIWNEYLSNCGETVDETEWELVHETSVTDTEAEKKFIGLVQYNNYASGLNRKSKMDSGLYKVRYEYSRNLNENSRSFCRKMVALSNRGKVYRWEDISIDSDENNMSDNGVNSQFAKSGESTYDLWKWKGGKHCHHYWKRNIYKRKLASGEGKKGFLPDEPDNYTQITVIEAIRKGVPLKDISSDYAIANTPTIDIE